MIKEASEIELYLDGFTNIDDLIKLFLFERDVSKTSGFSSAFEFDLDTDKKYLKMECDCSDYIDSVYPFALATGCGSSYAFWVVDGNKNLNTVPIIALGSEGGIRVVANNILELMHILTFDEEPMIDWENLCYYKDEDEDDSSEKSKEYSKWIKEEYNLEPLLNCNHIVENAVNKHQKNLDVFMKRFFDF